MSSITNIKKAITEIKKITDQPHYKKLDDELNYLINQSIAITVEEYKSLLRLTRLYISTILYVVEELYTLSGDESAFKTKIDSLSNNKTFEYNIKPANGSIQKKTVNYSYFDTFSFDTILTILNAVNNNQSINNSQFFLPSSLSDRNEIADKITVNLNTIIQERVNINRYLESIKTNASKLKVPPTPSTTPTSVANSNGKTVNDYIKEFEENDYRPFNDVNKELEENENRTLPNLKQNANNKPCLTEQIQVHEKHINLVEKYENDILKFNKTPKYTKADIDKTLAGLKKDIEILKELLKIAKGATQDSKPTPSASPTPSPTTPTTPTKPDEKKPEVPLTPEQWGIKFTAGKSFYMDLLPARQSTIPVQGGRDVPNAMPGLNYKLVTQVGKQPIPGFSPVYQNLGVKGMQVTIVGAFTGADGDNTRGTDTPIPKDSKDKTPTWINPKGSPSTSDNPGRGGKLPELSAYNSYTEFVQLCQQGKHMEVEINLFQVYKENIASKIGQDIKLQSTSGNPKFNGIVRSLDVYHATKERTWYTLVMDVTDFGMASKDPIDLNNELDEAVKAAQAELNRIKGTEAKEAATPTSEVANEALDKINKSNLSAEDKNKKRKIVEWFAQLSREAVNSKGFLDPRSNDSIVKQITGKSNFSYVQTIPLTDGTILVKIAQGCSFAGDLLGKYQAVRDFLNLTNVPVLNIASAPTRFIQDLIGAAFFDPSISLAIESNNRNNFTCDSENYFHFTPGDEIINEYIGNGKNTKKGPYYDDFSTSNTLSSLLAKKAQRLTIAEVSRTVAEALGCVAVGIAAEAAAGATLSLGTAAPAYGLKGLFQSATFCSAGIASSLYQRYNTVNQPSDVNEDDVVKQLAASFDVWKIGESFLIQYGISLGIGGISKAIPKITKQGGNVSGFQTLDELNLIKNRSVSIPPNQPNLLTRLLNLTDEQVLKGQQILVKSKTGSGTDFIEVESIRKIDSGNKGNFIIVAKNTGQVYTVDDIVQVPNTVFTQPTVTTNTTPDPANSSTATSSQTAGSTVSRLTKEIDDLKLADNITKEIKSLTHENQRKVLTVIKTKKANPTKSFTISREGQPDLLVNPEDTFSISSSGFVVRKGSVVYDIPYIDVTGSKIVKTSSVPNTTNQTAPPPQSPTQPSSSQNIPDNQSSSPTQQPRGGSQGSTVPIPSGLNEYSTEIFAYLNPYSGKQGIPDIVIKTNGSSYKVNNFSITGDSIQIKGFRVDELTGARIDTKIVTINSKIKAIQTLKNSSGNNLVSLYSVKTFASLDNFLSNVKSNEVVYTINDSLGSNGPGNTYSLVRIQNIQKINRNIYSFMDRDAVKYQKVYKFSDGTSINVETLDSEFTISKTKQSGTVKNNVQVPNQQATSVKSSSNGTSYKLVTNKNELKTYISNLSEGDIIFYDRDDNLGVQFLRSFTGANEKEAKLKIISKNFNGKYVINFPDEVGRISPTTCILSLDELVKFINGISVPI